LFVNFFFSASVNIRTRGVQANGKIGLMAGKASGKFAKGSGELTHIAVVSFAQISNTARRFLR
jgi:hypothetical protein